MSRKKHVIPRNEYKRQRREFFHNEEREKRIEQEKKEYEIKKLMNENFKRKTNYVLRKICKKHVLKN